MPFYPDMEPLHTGTDLELIQKLTRECSGEYEIACRALAALGWRFDHRQGMWWKPGHGADPPSISMPALEEICSHLDEGKRLLQVFRSMGWDREARIIVRAIEDLPTVVRVANHMAKYGAEKK
jgi:hypothetical protein